MECWVKYNGVVPVFVEMSLRFIFNIYLYIYSFDVESEYFQTKKTTFKHIFLMFTVYANGINFETTLKPIK